MPRDEALVIFRGQKVLKVKKFDFTKHPESKSPYMKECNASDYIPLWRLKDMGGGKIVDTFTGEVVQEEAPSMIISLDKALYFFDC